MTSDSIDKKKLRLMMVRMLVGAVIGAAVTAGFLAYFGEALLDSGDPGTPIGLVAGLSYLLIGAMVAVGMAAPKVGTAMLNVEDAEELREEAPKLRSGVAALALTGLFLLVLTFAGASLLSREIALPLAIACLAGVAVSGWLGAKKYDEMTRRLGEEAATVTLQAALLLFGGWAALAQLGYVGWAGPLTLISVLAMLQLLASFYVIGRKGMLVPR